MDYSQLPETPITIKDAMEKIYHREYLIPAFQREYVWDAMRVENCLSYVIAYGWGT